VIPMVFYQFVIIKQGPRGQRMARHPEWCVCDLFTEGGEEEKRFLSL
jgi:hypothetical protein